MQLDGFSNCIYAARQRLWNSVLEVLEIRVELIATTDVTLGLEQTVCSSSLLLRILYRVLVEQLAHHNHMCFSGRTKLVWPVTENGFCI
jgi:hypothetical protein